MKGELRCEDNTCDIALMVPETLKRGSNVYDSKHASKSDCKVASWGQSEKTAFSRDSHIDGRKMRSQQESIQQDNGNTQNEATGTPESSRTCDRT